MDADGLDPATYAAVIADLARVNTVTLARWPTIAWLRRQLPSRVGFTLLDVGFGHGDMLRAIARWLQGRGLHAELAGIGTSVPKGVPGFAVAFGPGLAAESFRFETVGA